MTSLLVRGGTVVRATGDERVDVLVEDGIVRDVHDRAATPPKFPAADNVIDASGQLLFPGFIDSHVHFREPGFEEKGTMETESLSALFGGVVAVVEMPNTRPPTTSISALRDKVRTAKGLSCDIRFLFGVTEKEHLKELLSLWSGEDRELKSRLCGVKVFFDHSTGNQKAGALLIEETFRACAEAKIPVVAHCEDPGTNARAAKQKHSDSVSEHSSLRPPESEERAIARAIDLVATYGTALHIAHLSTKQGLLLVEQAKKDSLSVTCEVTPHHLFLSTEDYAALGTLAKMNPPLRTRDHCEALWEGIERGVVDCVSSDHAPHTLEEKQSIPPLSAPSGVPGVETMIPLLLTVAAGKWPHPTSAPLSRKLMYSDIRRLCFENPNKIFSFGKQGISEGGTADLILVKPGEEWTLSGKTLHSKCGWTPYEGWNVTGKATVVGRW